MSRIRFVNRGHPSKSPGQQLHVATGQIVRGLNPSKSVNQFRRPCFSTTAPDIYRLFYTSARLCNRETSIRRRQRCRRRRRDELPEARVRDKSPDFTLLDFRRRRSSVLPQCSRRVPINNPRSKAPPMLEQF
ncbi:hypothetical protein KM043_013043 [Ampulex compressa]|nr:hypothetical protein KM043_013043 [Ampulex compressa]